MSDSIDINKECEKELGMLFLFDVVASTSYTQVNGQTGEWFLEQLIHISDNVIADINSDTTYNVKKLMNTGDGQYFFSKEPVACILLWKYLQQAFGEENISIRCGAGYGRVKINYPNIGTDLGSEVSRICGISKKNELTVSKSLWNLIRTERSFASYSLYSKDLPKIRLKGYDNTIDLVRISSEPISSYMSRSIRIPAEKSEIFIGRNDILLDCVNCAKETFAQNHILTIMGVSGAGKTTLARAVAKQLDRTPVVIDLRNTRKLRELHKAITHIAHDHLKSENLDNFFVFNGPNTILEIFDRTELGILIFDHSELLLSVGLKEIKNFIGKLNRAGASIILTTTDKLPFKYQDIFPLGNPSDSEKIRMLSHWIKCREEWLKEISDGIINHSYLICLVGKNCRGEYENLVDLQNSVNIQLAGKPDAKSYIKGIVEKAKHHEKMWLYLASCFRGSLYHSAIPDEVKSGSLFNALDPKFNDDYIVFHPLVMSVIEEVYPIENDEYARQAYDELCSINKKSKTIINYYKYNCASLFDKELAERIFFNNWQLWSEEFDSSSVQVWVEDLLNRKQGRSVFNIYNGIIMLFQGDDNALKKSSQICFECYNNTQNDVIIRLLALMEYIEGERKQKGVQFAVSLICEYINDINGFLRYSFNKLYISEGKYYHLGTVFFLLGNILRALEDHEGALEAYKKADEFIELSEKELENAELQKHHIAYGIAESSLKAGQYNYAISKVNDRIRKFKGSTKFAKGLLYLLEARAQLCFVFKDAKADEYKKGIKCIKTARQLFEQIKYPYYTYRCMLVEGAFYAKTRQRKKSNEILNQLVMKVNNPTNEMSCRAQVLIKYNRSLINEIDDEMLNHISNRKDTDVSVFYRMIAKRTIESQKIQNIKTIHVQENQMIETVFEKRMTPFNSLTWRVD